jgi:hypothetical protein
MTWDKWSRIYTARLLKQLPKPERNAEIKRMRIWQKYA